MSRNHRCAIVTIKEAGGRKFFISPSVDRKQWVEKKGPSVMITEQHVPGQPDSIGTGVSTDNDMAMTEERFL